MADVKKVLVLGATGAMGQYLVPILAKRGYQVDAVSLDEPHRQYLNVNCLKLNAKDKNVFRQLMDKNYDGVVDFMIYNSQDLPYYLPCALDHTGHYIYLSSYRIYDNKEIPIRETSPRLLDTADDTWLRDSDDYSIYKARGENMLRNSHYANWTAIRPAITYSKLRYQLVTLEAPNTVGRAFRGKPTLVPQEAKDVQATMSWAGNAAQMIDALLFNQRALREIFTISTAEHHTWGEIAEYYQDICGLKAIWIPKEDYLNIINPDPYARGHRWQLEVDRLFTRIIDNSKVLSVTGLKQENFMTLYEGLKYEIARCPKDYDFPNSMPMDDYLAEHPGLC